MNKIIVNVIVVIYIVAKMFVNYTDYICIKSIVKPIIVYVVT